MRSWGYKMGSLPQMIWPVVSNPGPQAHFEKREWKVPEPHPGHVIPVSGEGLECGFFTTSTGDAGAEGPVSGHL